MNLNQKHRAQIEAYAQEMLAQGEIETETVRTCARPLHAQIQSFMRDFEKQIQMER